MLIKSRKPVLAESIQLTAVDVEQFIYKMIYPRAGVKLLLGESSYMIKGMLQSLVYMNCIDDFSVSHAALDVLAIVIWVRGCPQLISLNF